MAQEIVIIRNTGIPLFRYSTGGPHKIDEVIAAFLSAVGSFVESTTEQEIQAIAFADSKFVWVEKGDLYFIALVRKDDSVEIYRAILKELAERFVGKYYEVLRNTDDDSSRAQYSRFQSFADTVELVLRRFDGIPGIARRYHTILLPPSVLHDLKSVLSSVEREEVLRGAALTDDGHIIVSNLRMYELEALLDMLVSIAGQTAAERLPITIVHPSLDMGTSFVASRCDEKIVVFVVTGSVSPESVENKARAFLNLVCQLDLSDVPRVAPVDEEGPVALNEEDVVVPVGGEITAGAVETLLAERFPDSVHRKLVGLLGRHRGLITVGELARDAGLRMSELSELLALLVARGVVRIRPLYAKVCDRDERFLAYLEVIGMPKRDYEILDAIWEYCDGKTPVRVISARTHIPPSRILEVLRALGNNVTWATEPILEDARSD